MNRVILVMNREQLLEYWARLDSMLRTTDTIDGMEIKLEETGLNFDEFLVSPAGTPGTAYITLDTAPGFDLDGLGLSGCKVYKQPGIAPRRLAASLRRFQHSGWFVQSKPNRTATGYIAWASKDRLDDVLTPSKGEVYFQFGATEGEAVNKVLAEIDAL